MTNSIVLKRVANEIKAGVYGRYGSDEPYITETSGMVVVYHLSQYLKGVDNARLQYALPIKHTRHL